MASAAANTAALNTAAPPIDAKTVRLVIVASSLGTVFEWYDFFIYGTLAAVIGKLFFPSDNPTLQLLLALASFAVGFGFRPLGAVLFGYLGDRLGRKYTFLVTITVMGIATAGIGLVPGYAAIGVVAPVLIILLRIAQGLALGGEYGGAAIYVAEHSPPGKAGWPAWLRRWADFSMKSRSGPAGPSPKRISTADRRAVAEGCGIRRDRGRSSAWSSRRRARWERTSTWKWSSSITR